MAYSTADPIAQPLSQFRRGEATILFQSGQVLETLMDAETARRLSKVVGGTAASEALSWSAYGWVMLTGTIDAVTWRPLPDDGWERPEKWRKADAAIGFHEGLLRGLAQHFELRGGPEPAFSIEALGLLQSLINAGTDRGTILTLAERMDGVESDAGLRALVATVRRASRQPDPHRDGPARGPHLDDWREGTRPPHEESGDGDGDVGGLDVDLDDDDGADADAGTVTAGRARERVDHARDVETVRVDADGVEEDDDAEDPEDPVDGDERGAPEGW